MKTIGLLGGMSWESTQHYYRIINQAVKGKLGGLHSAQIAMISVDFDPIERLQHEDNWAATADLLSKAALNVQAAGADFLLICTNTMHKVAPQIEATISIPLIHIADATGESIRRTVSGRPTVGLIGTAFTMEQPFYRERLLQNWEIEVIIPSPKQRQLIHKVIYDELCRGIIRDESKVEFQNIVDDLSSKGAQAIILGCTEIGLLIQQADTAVKLLDTTEIHAQKAVELAIE